MATLGTFVAGQVLTAAELNAIGTWTTYTPTVASSSGTITSYTVTAQHSVFNDLAVVRYEIVITNNGTGSGSLLMSVPFAPTTDLFQPGCGFGWEGAVVGFTVHMYLDHPSYTNFAIRKYDNTYPGGTNHNISGVAIYKVA